MSFRESKLQNYGTFSSSHIENVNSKVKQIDSLIEQLTRLTKLHQDHKMNASTEEAKNCYKTIQKDAEFKRLPCEYREALDKAHIALFVHPASEPNIYLAKEDKSGSSSPRALALATYENIASQIVIPFFKNDLKRYQKTVQMLAKDDTQESSASYRKT